jgi:SAM-dependent methyltransferase
MDARAHWDTIYRKNAPEQVSWYQPHLETSLSLIEQTGAGPHASLIDVGAGESTLVDDLLARGYSQLTVLDISSAAIAACRERLGAGADGVRWVAADITQCALEPAAYDVWHDRAVFHFLTDEADRAAYVRTVVRSVRRGGHVIVSAFGVDGPSRCSGLEVVRYNAGSLHAEFGVRFRLVSSSREVHNTPFGTTQQFLYCYCVVQ